MKKITNTLLIIACLLMGMEMALAQSSTLKKANDYFEQTDYTKSVELYKKVLKKNESDKIALEQMAHAYRLMNRFEEAEQWYQRAMIFNSNKPLLKFHYAQTLMTNGKYSEAAKYFEEYAQKVPYDSRGTRFAESCRTMSTQQQDSEMYQIKQFAFNSPSSDLHPSFYKEGMVFTSTIEGRQTDVYYTQINNRQSTSPTTFTGINPQSYIVGAISFNKAGTKMYFSRDIGRENQTGNSHLKTFEASLVGGQWTNVRELPFNNNFYSVGYPTLSLDDRTLYISSNMPGGYGGNDLYVSSYENGTWSKPRNLGNVINTEGDEIQPFIHSNGALYYASNGLGGLGGFDVFGATAINSNKWKVENVGSPINSSSDDYGLILTDDFNKGYFASNRKGGKGNYDIYQITINEAKAAEMMAKVANQSSLHTFQINYLKSKNKAEKASKYSELFSTKGYFFGQKDLKLVLVGIVLNKETKEPIEGALVILRDKETSDKQEFTTQNDGNFYFKLEAERQYELFKQNASGDMESAENVSTIDKDETQIMHAILESSSASINMAKRPTENDSQIKPAFTPNLQTPSTDTFEVNDSEEHALSTTYNNGYYSDSQLYFKIQIGAFRQKLENDSEFLGKVKADVDTEKTRNGMIRYMIGKFDDFADAEQYRVYLLRQGYTKSFVAAYINNVRLDMPVEEVLQRLK
ncbi:MAG: tetratricopeptide repeat protein [Chitinophagales bacterium]